ncbi:hypothetical protein E2C01_077480 [Portunus trituberculatus]|uniref:Uncharacterized protein n=1 Tax=Portunus trituberculatus TaxID=210409 RepID=A0A5B7IM84_PORTR|nr:hypothetical protein [Portunus trituberculatus]
MDELLKAKVYRNYTSEAHVTARESLLARQLNEYSLRRKVVLQGIRCLQLRVACCVRGVSPRHVPEIVPLRALFAGAATNTPVGSLERC